MGYLGSWKVGDSLTFCANTHAALTGAATNADAAPVFRVFEDETSASLASGAMAALASANTVGFYSEQLALSSATGFEKGKSYNIYISAAVSSVTGTMHHTFQIEAEVDANVVSDKTGYTSSVSAGGISSAAFVAGAINNAATSAGLISSATFAAGAINNAATAAGLISSATFAASALNAAAVAADVTTEITAALATSASIATLASSANLATVLTRLGTPSDLGSGATVAANLADIEAQTDDIGAAGAGLTAVPWNAAWDAEVQSEVEDALVVHRLDELLNADSDIDGAAPPTVGSVIHELMSKTAGSFTYDQTTDSLEALRDRGDAAWITATGFSTHSASDVWAVGTRVLTAATNISGPIADQVWEEAIADHSGTAGSTAEALGAAGSAGDPWSTALPGAYGAGTAGKIIGDNINATVSSRLASASYTAPLDAAGTRTAVGLASANLDTQIGDLPTNAEMEARTISSASYATSAAVAALASSANLATLTTTVGAAGAGLTALVSSATGATLATSASVAALNNLSSAQLATAVAPLATSASIATLASSADIAAVKAKTDQMAYGVTNALNVNATHMNEAEIAGTGSSADLWRGV